MKHHFRAIRVLRFSKWLLLGLHPVDKINTWKDSFPEVQGSSRFPPMALPFHCPRGAWTRLEENQVQ